MKLASKLSPVPDVDKVSNIVVALQEYIIEGGLTPGTPIPAEREMASSFGVSRYSLREALRVAEAQGLIDIQRGCRPKVAEPSFSAAMNVMSINLRRSQKVAKDLIEARQNIECGIAKFAALRARPEQVESLRKCINDMDDNPSNIKLCMERDIEFHNLLLKASDNEIFAIMVEPLAELLRTSRTRTMQIDVRRAIVGHKSILKAIEDKDPEGAAMAMHRHLEMALEDLNTDKGE
jgi:GntR family transcriptional repressor for pyruvate dehydrogenase complex